MDQEIEPVQAVEQGLDGDAIGDVERLDTDALEGGVGPRGEQFLFGQAAGDHVGTGGLESERHGAADAGRAPGHEGLAAREIETAVHLSPPEPGVEGNPGIRGRRLDVELHRGPRAPAA